MNKTSTMSENEGTIVLDGGLSANNMTIDGNHKKLEASTSGTENITAIQEYLDSFHQEIEENEENVATQVQTDGDPVEHAYFIDQNVQYYYQTITGDGHMVMVGGLLEHDAQMMANTNENNMDNVTQIVLPNVQDKIEKDIPQIVALGSGSGYQTVPLVQADADANNYVHYVVEQQNDKNDETSNISKEISLEDHDPDYPDVNNVYDFNDGKDPTLPKKQEIVDFGEKDDKSKIPKKSQTITQAHMCNYCNYSTGKRYLLTRHIKSHSKVDPYKCTVCERVFNTLTYLKNHLNTHSGTKPYQCQCCPKAFTTSGELSRHVRYKHNHEKPHKCTICDYACVELCKMRNHMKCHTGERTYQCPHCTYASLDTFKLKSHLLIHTSEKPYECDICFSRFTRSNTLKNHRVLHSDEKPVFKCDQCPATCSRKTDLRIHVQNLHTSDEPIKCERCGDAFPDRYQYKVHYKSHGGEKSYKCKLCPHVSVSQRYLETHMLKHTDEMPFNCKLGDQ